MARGEESGLLQVHSIANLSMKTEPDTRAQRNIKNEGCSQDVIENKGLKKRHNVPCQDVYEIK
jgi:hypothetical protein